MSPNTGIWTFYLVLFLNLGGAKLFLQVAFKLRKLILTSYLGISVGNMSALTLVCGHFECVYSCWRKLRSWITCCLSVISLESIFVYTFSSSYYTLFPYQPGFFWKARLMELASCKSFISSTDIYWAPYWVLSPVSGTGNREVDRTECVPHLMAVYMLKNV